MLQTQLQRTLVWGAFDVTNLKRTSQFRAAPGFRIVAQPKPGISAYTIVKIFKGVFKWLK